MKFGIAFTNIGPFATSTGARAMGEAAEAAGFESLWTVEHVIIPAGYKSEYPYDASGRMPAPDDFALPDPMIWLSFVASCTSTIRLATGILIVPQRNPIVLAKECASLDLLSEGRFTLGVGAGWLEEEFDMLGIPFADRGARLDDYVAAMRALWEPGTSEYSGAFSSFSGANSFPKPVQPSIPIVVGGHSKVAARRAGRLGDGFFPGRNQPDELAELVKTMRQAAEDADRDPDAIELTVSGESLFGPDPVGAVEELAAAGAQRVVIPPLAFDPEGLRTQLARFGEDVISRTT